MCPSLLSYNNRLSAVTHQNVLTLCKTYGYLSGLATNVHQFRILLWNSLSQKENGVLVLLMTNPERNMRTCQEQWESTVSTLGPSLYSMTSSNVHLDRCSCNGNVSCPSCLHGADVWVKAGEEDPSFSTFLQNTGKDDVEVGVHVEVRW